MALIHWLALSLTPGIGPITVRKLVAKAGSAQLACACDAAELRQVEGIGLAKSTKIAAALATSIPLAEEELEKAQKLGLNIVCPEDQEYPPLLHSIYDPPTVLYVKGSIQPRDLNGIGMVGSRKCSFYGREQAERFAAVLAGAGFTVVSGGARGVDSAAHRGAIQHPQGRTIAVLGSGIDVVYPPENADLFNLVVQHGAVVSEYPIGTPPVPENFPRRNRIISGMTRGILVIEADERSGALITARQAIDDHNRPVFALPGRVDNPSSAGPHKLIRDGATLVTCLEHIVEGLGPLPEQLETILQDPEEEIPPAIQLTIPTTAPAPLPLSQTQSDLLHAMGDDQVSVDQLMDATGFPAHQILQELTMLSLKGQVKRINGQTYARNSFIRN